MRTEMMMIRKLAAISLLLLISFVASGVTPVKPELESMYDKAFRAFDSASYDEALTALDAIDAAQPNLAESLNLRGVVYMRQGKYDRAEAALRKALSIEPKFWNASFNLAEIPFLRKDWPEARNRFEVLIAGDNQGIQPETIQLIQYKILLTFVLQGKENMVDWILNKFELSKDSPALYYSNAAIALQHKNQKEADEWLAAADKHFPAPLNKLYAESLYEVGWMKKPAGEPRTAIEITSTTERVERLKREAKVNFEKAERAFQQRDFDEAMRLLDLAGAAVPNDPAADNLRGEILMEQKRYDEAETVLRKAYTANPKLREAQYNLAQIPFKKGEYAKARDRFEELFGETPGDDKNQASQLIKFKIYMTLLLEGKEKEAQQLMDQFKFTGDTPALYYAHAAWEFQNQRPEKGNDWIDSARKIYSPALNVVFVDSFYDLGWLQKTETSEGPPTFALAQANASPSAEPKPAMRLGQAEPLRSLEEASATPASESSPATTGSPAPAPATSAASPAPVVAAAQPSAPPLAVQNASIAPATSLVTSAPVAGSAPVATSAPVAESQSAPSTGSESALGEMFGGASQQRTLLIAALALGGILLLTWLVVQQVRRDSSAGGLYHHPTPLTEPPFAGEGSGRVSERGVSELASTGPPKLSLNLKASEPVGRAITAPDSVPGLAEPEITEPGEVEQPVTEAAPAPAPAPEIPAAPPERKRPAWAGSLSDRDKKEVSVPAVVEQAPVQPAVAVASATEQAPEKVEAPAVTEAVPAPLEIAAAPVLQEAAPEKPAEEEVEAEEPAVEPAEAAPVPAFAESADLSEKEDEPVWVDEEPVGQGEPIPELTTAFAAEPIISELVQPEPESPLELIEPEADLAMPIAGRRPVHSSIESPSFASKIITTEPIRLQPNTPVTMPETTITPASAPVTRAPAPTVSVQQPAGGMHTSVQITFSLEIASMQLTPTFKMSGLQLKPTSKIVSMRLAPSQDPQPPMNLQVTFEVAKIELSNGAIGTIRLAPSAQQKPAVLTSPSFAISELALVSGQGAAPVQLTPSHQEQASVQLTAEFQIAAIEFTPLFEIASIALNASSKKVSMQLPGAGPSSIDNAPVFEIENVQLGPGNELGLIQVAPGRPA
jgi:tetratricopeptide (TPR) repeat protein